MMDADNVESNGERASGSWGGALWKQRIRECNDALKKSLSAKEYPAEQEFPWGVVVAKKPPSVFAQVRDIFLDDGYLFRPDNDHPRIIDCGGNIGLSAIWFRGMYPGCRITVYEADPDLVGTIQQNLKNAQFNDVEVINAAVWDSEGLLRFSGIGDDCGKLHESGDREVRSIDIGSIVDGDVDLLKMDIEGAEYDCFDRLFQTGAIDRIKNIVVELHLSQATTDRALSLMTGLRRCGFQLAFSSTIADWLGNEEQVSTFSLVGSKKTFMQLFAWREGSCPGC